MNKQESAAKLEEMRRLYEEENLNLRQIGERFDLTYQAVHDRFVRNGIVLRKASQELKRLDCETLKSVYIDENLTLGETARRLGVSILVLKRELERCGIEKRAKGVLNRKHPQMYQIKIRETLIIPRPKSVKPYSNLYDMAKKAGIIISIRSIDDEKFEITRVK